MRSIGRSRRQGRGDLRGRPLASVGKLITKERAACASQAALLILAPATEKQALFLEAAEKAVEFLDLQFALARLAADFEEFPHVALGAFGAAQLLKQIALIAETIGERLLCRVDRLL